MGLDTAVRKLQPPWRRRRTPRYVDVARAAASRLYTQVSRRALEPDGFEKLPAPTPLERLAQPKRQWKPSHQAEEQPARGRKRRTRRNRKPSVNTRTAQGREHAGRGPAGASVAATAAAVVLALGYLLVDRFWLSRTSVSRSTPAAAWNAAAAGGAQRAVAEQSIAVLPFVDMSEGKDSEYFSDGLSEELIERLEDVGLRVMAYSSYYWGKPRKLQ